ncbi:unnamed protein product [Cercopithifilaria johnstoni]|uniref:Secreted protein n=1 Tax=Cercopithifilaria johnstoni TaxID=2874296 RepID=A0A8J2MRM9_9BILA|nr:unnamed protein product [Cercopithifilaria johnstoni]
MYRMVILSFLLQMLLCVQLHLCQKTNGTIPPLRKHDARGLFVAPHCCEEPWFFDPNTGQCILNMVSIFLLYK